ncbi:protein rep [Myroides odoratimimus]
MANLLQKRESSKGTLKKKQWSKYVSKGIALSLMHFNSKSKLFKSYKNSTYCAETLLTNEVGKIHTTYCKNRWCLTCNRIKTARLINAYLPQLEELFQPVFVTLTLPTVSGEDLSIRIAEMEKEWRAIYKNTKQGKYKKTYQIFKGIRKAECTIRPGGLYHYHFHFIIDGWAEGEWLIGQWLKRFPHANRLAQDIRFADEFSFKELFKYAFKAEVKSSSKTNAERYDLVFNALKGKRTYQAFGGIKAIEEEFDEDDLEGGIVLEGMANRIFKWCTDDWYDKADGNALVGLKIPEKVKKLTNYPK